MLFSPGCYLGVWDNYDVKRNKNSHYTEGFKVFSQQNMFSLSIHVGEYISMRKIDMVICQTFSCSKIANKIHFKSSNIILFNYSHHKSEDKKSYNKKSYLSVFHSCTASSWCVKVFIFIHLVLQREGHWGLLGWGWHLQTEMKEKTVFETLTVSATQVITLKWDLFKYYPVLL